MQKKCSDNIILPFDSKFAFSLVKYDALLIISLMSKAYNKKTTEFFNNPTASSHRVQFLHHEPHSKQLTKKSLTIECNIPHIERDVK